MLPQVPASKRSTHGFHLTSRHHASYHPYYSSSPMNSSNPSNVKRIEKNGTDELNYLDISVNINNSSNPNSTNNTPSKFSLYYNRSSLSTNNGSDLDADLSSVSAKTPNSRPPTTPVSSSNCNNSLNLDDQLIQSNSASPLLTSNQPDPINGKSISSSSLASREPNGNNASIIFVTPATNSCLSASSSVSQCMNKLDQSESRDQLKTESSSSSASVYSSAVATYSRSSSMNSLNSFDVKSTHSSIPSCSEYSAMGTNPSKNMQNNEDMYSTKYQGCVTPTAYSELPSSPGELFPCNFTAGDQQAVVNESRNFYFMTNVIENSANNRNTNRPIPMNEISVCTVDSNPSKSNDITVIERTVIANHTHSHNNTHLSAGFAAGSIGNTFIEHNDNVTPENHIDDEEDNVIQYDMEGSLWDAASVPRSNVSGLTFPSEPTADLAFIRNLLNRKSTPMSVNKDIALLHEQKHESLLEYEKTDSQLDPNMSVLENSSQQMSLNNNGQNLKYQWSNYSLSKQFTPPIKLKEHVEAASNLAGRTNKKLFEDEEESETRSLASLPSEIAYDQSQTINFKNKSQFSALFSRLESAGGLNNSPASFKDNLRDARYLKSFSIQKKANVYDDGLQPDEATANIDNPDVKDEHVVEHSDEYDSYYQQHHQESDDDDDGVSSDEEFLNEFINEMLPKSAMEENDEEEEDIESVNEEEEDLEKDIDENLYEYGIDNEVVNDEDFDQEQQMQKYLAERSMYRNESDHVLTRILPKIDEVDNENDDSKLVEEESQPKCKDSTNSSDKIAPYHAMPAPKLSQVNVVMTKTALLREKKNKASQSKQMNKPGKKLANSAQPVKNNENVCGNQKKKAAMVSAGYDRPTKSSTVRNKSNQVPNPNGTNIKLNTLKNSKSFNSSN